MTVNATLRVFLLALFLAALAGGALAQDDFNPEQAEKSLDDFEAQLADTSLDEEHAQEIGRRAASLRAAASQCVRSAGVSADRIRSDLSRLGAASDTDTAEVIEQRVTFEDGVDRAEVKAAACRLVMLRTERVAESAAQLQRELSAARLFSQDQNSLAALATLGRHFSANLATARSAVFAHPAYMRTNLWSWITVVLGTGLAVLAGYWLRIRTRHWCDLQHDNSGAPTVRAILARSATRFAPLISGGAVAALALTVYATDPGLDIFLLRVALCTLLYGIGRALLVWYTGPYSPGEALTTNAEMTAMVRTRFHALLVGVLIGLAVFGTDWLGARPGAAHLPFRSVLTVFVVTCFIWIVRMARRLPAVRGRLIPLRALLILASVVAVGADLSGYRNLANYLLAGVLATLLGGLVLWTLLWLMRATVHGISEGRSEISARMRSWLGIRAEASSAELGWLRLVLALGLWLAFAFYLVWSWDTTGNAVDMVTDKALHGIQLRDDVSVVPINILVGLITFGILIALTAWIKARLETRWLREMGMDRGSRDALVTLAGYVGFILAALLGLVLAGVKFAGLALVAGALSVGIGFGLQNIVNNFVSGLILLFERPIKSGDFVSVGAVEGWVRNIRIRSTEIETLDRQNVIVPNSELVSTQVVNWVLHDPHGRLRLPVGVAYGSDTGKVIEILEEAAKAHPDVITQGRAPAPRALFMGFGDSSLDFELRAWIRQIERRFAVTSDLNLAIDKAFRELGIEIPFPQRDLHVRSWDRDAAVSTRRKGENAPDAQFAEADEDDRHRSETPDDDNPASTSGPTNATKRDGGDDRPNS